MKKKPPPRVRWVIAIASITAAASSPAGIIGINTPVTSTAQITFDDTNSNLPPNNGSTWVSGPLSPWNGATLTLVPTTDPNTLDYAQGDIGATFAGNGYMINIANVVLTQTPGNTGYATLDFLFNIEFQLDGAGLPLQPTLFPNFLVSGTVQSTPGSFAALGGRIDYLAVTTAGTIGVVETVNYNSQWNTPGPFSALAVGIPVNGITPALVANTTLTLNGQISFKVDPATISADSVPGVPEPPTALLMGLTGLLAMRRYRKAREKTRRGCAIDRDGQRADPD